MFQRTDTAFGAVIVQRIPATILRERLCGTDTGRARTEHFLDRFVLGKGDVVLLQRLRQGETENVFHIAVQQACAVQLAEDPQHAAGAVHIFHMVFLGTWRHFTQLRHLAGQLVDIAHGEVDFGFLCRRQQVQNGVGGAAHGDIQRHGVLKRFFARDVARQRGYIILLVVAFGQLNDALARGEEQCFAVSVGGQQRAVTRLRQTQRFGQAVHRVGGEHAGTGAAGWAGRTFNLFALRVRDFRVRALNHRIYQVEFNDFVRELGFSGFHRAAGNEDNRNVQAQRGHQHPRGDFVAVGDTDHRIGAVGVHHILDGVGNQLAGRQRVKHAAMAHSDTIIHRNGIELFSNAAGGFDLLSNQFTEVAQVNVARHELGKRVYDSNNRFTEVIIGHPGGAPQCAGARHIAAVSGGGGTVFRHALVLPVFILLNGVLRDTPSFYAYGLT